MSTERKLKRHKSASPTPTETWFSGIEAKRARSSEVADDSIIIPYAAPSCDPPEHTRIKRQMSPSLSLSAEQEPTKRARVSSSAAGNEDDNNLILPFSNLSIPATRAAKKRQISPPPPSSTEDTFPETKRVHVSSSSGENVPKHDKIPTPVVPLEKPGRVFVFGTGDAGQLGLGDEIDERRKPTPVRTLDKEEIVDIVCGGLHTLAISKDGKLWSWGCNDEGALGRSGQESWPHLVENLCGIKVVKAACGDSISMALSDKGKLYCWGTFRYSRGRLGFSATKQVQKLPVLFEPLENETIVDIAAGADHCLALTEEGYVYSWGNNEQFQLGRNFQGCERDGLVPEKIDGLERIKAIGCGSFHSFALSSSTGDLVVWGLNNHQQCGLPTMKASVVDTCRSVNKPTIVTSLPKQKDSSIKSMLGGEHHSFVRMANGDIYAFGRADFSQLGLETTAGADIATPTRVTGLKDIVQIDSGTYHALAVDHMGRVFTWGFGEMLALGTGTEDDVCQPYLLDSKRLDGYKVLSVAAGAQHSVILACRHQ